MICQLLQDYIYIRSDASTQTVTQNHSGWLDLSGFQDVVAFLDVQGFSPAPPPSLTISYQTSPSADDALFMNMVGSVALGLGVTVTQMLKATATVPLARWVRWQLNYPTPATAWEAYFRVWLACNRAGKRNTVALPADTRSRMLPSEPNAPYGSTTSQIGITGATLTPTQLAAFQQQRRSSSGGIP